MSLSIFYIHREGSPPFIIHFHVSTIRISYHVCLQQRRHPRGGYLSGEREGKLTTGTQTPIGRAKRWCALLTASQCSLFWEDVTEQQVKRNKLTIFYAFTTFRVKRNTSCHLIDSHFILYLCVWEQIERRREKDVCSNHVDWATGLVYHPYFTHDARPLWLLTRHK